MRTGCRTRRIATPTSQMEPEFDLARAMIEARPQAGLTQDQLAERMKTTQSVVARLGGGHVRPSTRTLERYAQATSTRLKISFEPVSVAE